MNKTSIIGFGMAALLSLTACKENKNKVGSASGAVAGSSSVPERNEEALEKSNLYIQATNDMGNRRSSNSVLEEWAEKARLGIDNKDYKVVKSSLTLSSRKYRSLRDKLQKAVDMPVAIEPADTEAKALIIELDNLLPVWEKLEKYNEMKKDADDGGAEGRKLMETFTPQYKKVLAQYADFEKTISALADQLKKQRMERFKKEGKLLDLYTEESIELARSMLEQFNSLDDFKNKEKTAKANEILKQLETKLEEQQAEYDRADKDGKNPDSSYKSVNNELSSFVGKYRDARGGDTYAAKNLTRNFNDAVEAYNRISWRR